MAERAGARRKPRAPAWSARDVLFVVVCGLIYYFAHFRDDDRERQEVELPLPPDVSGPFLYQHHWTETAEPLSFRLSALEVQAQLHHEDLRHMANAFGLPAHWQDLPAFGSARAESLARERIEERARDRGVKLSLFPELDIRPDYRWIIFNSRDDVADVARALSDLFVRRQLTTQRELHRVLASFVQSIRYDIPKSVRENRRGHSVLNLGIATPIEVLRNGWGDCDSKALLFASILEHFPREQVIFLIGADHLFVGVRAVPWRRDRYVNVQGVRYVLVELTYPWRLGDIPDVNWRRVSRNQFRIIAP